MSDKSLHRLGAEVVSHLGDGPGQEQVIEQRQRFLLAAQRRRSTSWRYALAAMGTAAAAVGLVFAMLSFARSGDVRFRIGADEIPGVEGHWVEAGDVDPVPIRFDGGSEFVLDKKAAARVVAANRKKVILDLSQGRVSCLVHGNGKTGWVVRAGTYRVRVTGTEFSVDWNPGDAHLDVGVTHGSVLVFGAALGEHGVKLKAGDRLSVGRDRTTITKDKMLVAEAQETGNEETETQEPGGPGLAREATSKARRKGHSDSPQRQLARKPKEADWRELYGDKDYSKVVDLITEQGLERFIAGASSKDLWRVGKAARYSRRGDVAHGVLKALVERFPESRQAQNAAFVLGRVAMELRGDPGAAERWFKRYVSETPSGPLAEEALGRLIDVCRQTGQNAAARKYAGRYLSRYPSGPYAQLAQSVLASKK